MEPTLCPMASVSWPVILWVHHILMAFSFIVLRFMASMAYRDRLTDTVLLQSSYGNGFIAIIVWERVLLQSPYGLSQRSNSSWLVTEFT